MNAAELREKSKAELEALGGELRKQLLDLRFAHYTGQLSNTAALRQARRDIARVETVLRAQKGTGHE